MKIDIYEKRIKELMHYIPGQFNKIAVQNLFFSQKITDDEFLDKFTATLNGKAISMELEVED